MQRYILVTGGELFNKGAQSMTFITVNELKKRFPEKQVILLSSSDFERSEKEKSRYSFEIKPLQVGMIFDLLGGTYRLLWRVLQKRRTPEYKSIMIEIKEILKRTDAIVDISGYSLSSQIGTRNSLGYLAKIMLAKKFRINIYIMPQSFGPFLYEGIYGPLMTYLIKKYMKYPKVIYAREQEGLDMLITNFGLKNVKKADDLVLSNTGFELSNIYKVLPETKLWDNVQGIGIIPNIQNVIHGNTNHILSFYDVIIKKLTMQGEKVFLIRHSDYDVEACKKIKERFSNNDQVILIDSDMSCIEFEKLVTKFDFIIGSRYHSIVHAYKNSIPCISLGWATKYRELLKSFNQEEYSFDIRSSMDMKTVEQIVDRMLECHRKESKIIADRLKEIQSINVFDVIEANKNEK